MSTNAYANFRCASLRIKKALGIFRELITTRTTTTITTTTTRVAFWDPPSGSKITCAYNNWRVASFVHRTVSKRQESRAVAREPRDVTAVAFSLKFADNIHYKFKSSQASKARLQRLSSRHTGAKQNLTQNGHSMSFKVTCFGVSRKAIRDCWPYFLRFQRYSARDFSSTKDPQSFRRSQIFCGSRPASAHLCWWRYTTKYSINRLYSK